MARTPRAITRTIEVLEAATPVETDSGSMVLIKTIDRDECLKALKRADARTRIDPSARKKRSPAKKAKKAGARRR